MGRHDVSGLPPAYAEIYRDRRLTTPERLLLVVGVLVSGAVLTMSATRPFIGFLLVVAPIAVGAIHVVRLFASRKPAAPPVAAARRLRLGCSERIPVSSRISWALIDTPRLELEDRR